MKIILNYRWTSVLTNKIIYNFFYLLQIEWLSIINFNILFLYSITVNSVDRIFFHDVYYCQYPTRRRKYDQISNDSPMKKFKTFMFVKQFRKILSLNKNKSYRMKEKSKYALS